MEKRQYEYGMIGLGTMGRNLVHNMSDHGFSVVGFDKDQGQVDALSKEATNKKVKGFTVLEEFVASLKTPRVILLLVPAGKIVDSVIAELKPLLEKDDLLIDCGNSHFTDTNLRMEKISKEPFHFMGTGISGGEAGARYGPSIMPGGAPEDYKRIAPMLEAISAKAGNEPCVTLLGPGSAGHYVKMVHNGIEYGLMQLISEAYQILKEICGLNNDKLHEVFATWNEGVLHSYLIGITADIFLQKDELTKKRVIDIIRDSAAQNGTGSWTSEDAMGLLVPIPTIDVAVSMRYLSANKEDRTQASKILEGATSETTKDSQQIIADLEQALYFAMITTYAQGMALLHTASEKYSYNLKLHDIAKIWRGGCIIRASLLEDIYSSLKWESNLPNLMMSEKLSSALQKSQTGIRKIIQAGVKNGIPMPALAASLAYYDAYRSEWLPANLIQAQRDCFGAHTYKRNDRDGVFHTHWNTKQT